MKFVKFLEELGKDDVNIVGGKGANLGEMYNAGLPIPEAFVVTAIAYKHFIEKTGLKKKIMNILKKTNVDDVEQLEKNTKRIRELILKTKMPKEIENEIIKSYEKLSKRLGKKEEWVAARSSATAEDIPGASFAGQQATFLNVRGAKNVLDAVKKCWASLFTARATFYREKKGFEHSKVYIAVVVQKQLGVLSEEEYYNGEYAAGVGFTIHPSTGDKTKIVIEGHWGQGESVVSGAVTPDTFVIDKKTGKIIEKHIVEKKVMRITDAKGGLRIVNVPSKLRKKPSLAEKQLRELWKIALKLEKHYKFPQDFEWAVEKGKVYLVQSRPVTVFYEKKAEQIKLRLKPILKGLGASPGVGYGKVKIIKKLEEISKIVKGDVLVTKMTNPDMVPAMKKASAIITDEGGMTCVSGNTLILTDKGFMKAKDAYERLREGENLFILSFDVEKGEPVWRRIIAAGRRRANTVKIFIKNGITHGFLDLTPDHKIYVLENDEMKKLELEKAIDLAKKLIMVTHVPEKIVSLRSPKIAYLVGLILGHSLLNAVKLRINSDGTVIQAAEDFVKEVIGMTTGDVMGSDDATRLIGRIFESIEGFVLSLDIDSTQRFLEGFFDSYHSRTKVNISGLNKKIVNALILASLKIGFAPFVGENYFRFPLDLGKLIKSGKKRNENIIKQKNFIYVTENGEEYVYNFEVAETEEIQKNFIVFSTNYVPVLVSNSHAAIVSRELSIPAVVGTGNATKVLSENQIVTVDGYNGTVYLGRVKELIEKEKNKTKLEIKQIRKLKTKTKILMNLGVPEKIKDYKDLPFDGIGLMRVEFIIGSYVKYHPLYLLENGKGSEYIRKLADGIKKVAKAIYPRFVIVRFSDFKTNEYRELKGGEKFEPKENNPMIGWRGVSRYISPEFEKAFRLEVRAIKRVRERYKLDNVWVMLPFVRTTWEVEKALKIVEEEGLKRGKRFKVYAMAEVPSIVFLADQFAKLVDGFSIGSNDLTQLVLGVDRDSEILGKMGYFDERNPAVLRAIEHLIKTAHKYGKPVSICGQAPSVYPEITEFLVKKGIDSISVNPDAVLRTRKLVYELEKKLKRK
ncbi:MAG: phosphoenolpyruvate synthase [Candidatus Aenigmarchaeota archaeon]|nr:phosphoenolpyruvate synthase [Candidatus Aenigmarchaeota archaeon]